MSHHQFTIGTTWLIEGTLNADDGTPLPTTGTTVKCRIKTNPPIDLDLDHGISWTNESIGAIQIVVAPADQPVGLEEGVYEYAVEAELATGVLTDQEWGTISALQSTFYEPPA